MLSTYKSIRKMIALFLVSLLALTACIGSVLAQDVKDNLGSRYLPPDATIVFSCDYDSSTGNTNNYKCKMSFACTPNVTKIAGTITIKQSTTSTDYLAHTSFVKTVSGTSGSREIVSFGVASTISTVYITTSNLRVYDPTYGWFYLADFVNHPCSLSNS